MLSVSLAGEAMCELHVIEANFSASERKEERKHPFCALASTESE